MATAAERRDGFTLLADDGESEPCCQTAKGSRSSILISSVSGYTLRTDASRTQGSCAIAARACTASKPISEVQPSRPSLSRTSISEVSR